MSSPLDGLRRLFGIPTARADAGGSSGYGNLAAWVHYLQGEISSSGVTLPPEKALSISSFAAAVEIHSEAVARLPLVVYRRLPGGGKVRATDHPYHRLLKVSPGSGLTAAEWRSLVQTDVETYGAAYCLKVFNLVDSTVRELIPIEARRVQVRRGTSGGIEYVVADEQGTRPAVTYSPRQVLQFMGPFGTPLSPSAPVRRYRELLGLAYVIERFIGASFRNGLRPSMVFGTDKTLTDKTRTNLQEWLVSEFAGSDKAGIAMVMEDGLKPLPFSQNFEQAQVVQLDEKVGLKIARVMRVPPHMLGFNIAQPRANMEQQAREYLDMGLGSRLERMEQSLNVALFGGSDGEFFAEFLFEDLLKGDPAVRAEFYSKLVTIGVMTRNEVRTRENLNPLPGLDDPLTPMNMNRGDEGRARAEVPAPWAGTADPAPRSSKALRTFLRQREAEMEAMTAEAKLHGGEPPPKPEAPGDATLRAFDRLREELIEEAGS